MPIIKLESIEYVHSGGTWQTGSGAERTQMLEDQGKRGFMLVTSFVFEGTLTDTFALEVTGD